MVDFTTRLIIHRQSADEQKVLHGLREMVVISPRLQRLFLYENHLVSNTEHKNLKFLRSMHMAAKTPVQRLCIAMACISGASLATSGTLEAGNQALAHGATRTSAQSNLTSGPTDRASAQSKGGLGAARSLNQLSAAWNVSRLPSDFGGVAPSYNHGWQPINLGTSTPVFALGQGGVTYMANSAGVWKRTADGWRLLQGSTDLGTAGYTSVTAMTVSKNGVLFAATNSQVWQYHGAKWVPISDGHEVNIQFLTWTPYGNLVAAITVYPKPRNTQSQGLGGPAPMGSIAFMAYVGHRWQSITGQVPYGALSRVRHVAWSPSGQLAVSFDYAGIAIHSNQGWTPVSLSGTPFAKGVVNDIAWVDGQLTAATSAGVWQYRNGLWVELAGMPATSAHNVIHLATDGVSVLAQVQNLDGSTSVWMGKRVGAGGLLKPVPTTFTGVDYVGLSPAGVPTVELSGNWAGRAFYQYTGGMWTTLDLTGLPDQSKVNPFVPLYPHDVTWSPTGQLTVSTRYNGVWAWDGHAWHSVGGTIDPHNPYYTGTVTWMKSGTLVANVREIIPPPPQTPSMEHNMTWLYDGQHWAHLAYPPGVTENLIQSVTVSPTGNLVMVESPTNALHVWLWHRGSWRQIADGTGLFKNNQIGGIIFSPTGKLEIALSGPFDPSQNGLYEYDGTTWRQILKNVSKVRVKDTYWFLPMWMQDGSLVFSVMNGTGYHLWRYTDGQWSDLGLSNQRIERMYVLPDDTLFAISDNHVCWVRKL